MEGIGKGKVYYEEGKPFLYSRGLGSIFLTKQVGFKLGFVELFTYLLTGEVNGNPFWSEATTLRMEDKAKLKGSKSIQSRPACCFPAEWGDLCRLFFKYYLTQTNILLYFM